MNCYRSFSFLALTLLFGVVASPAVYANFPDCSKNYSQYFERTICQQSELEQLKNDIQERYLNAQLMSNAPLQLLHIQQQAWLNYVRQCKSKHCLKTHFDRRLDDLTLVMTLNQSLTQHFVRYQKGKSDDKATTLQLHQLDKNRIKIDGIQYRNPNNSEAAQIAYLRSYTAPHLKDDIVDVESKCKYRLERTKYTLTFHSDDARCQRFNGSYKLYD